MSQNNQITNAHIQLMLWLLFGGLNKHISNQIYGLTDHLVKTSNESATMALHNKHIFHFDNV